jgi:hypothetical protein
MCRELLKSSYRASNAITPCAPYASPYARFILSRGRISLVPDTNTMSTVAYLPSDLYVSFPEHRA